MMALRMSSSSAVELTCTSSKSTGTHACLWQSGIRMVTPGPYQGVWGSLLCCCPLCPGSGQGETEPADGGALTLHDGMGRSGSTLPLTWLSLAGGQALEKGAAHHWLATLVVPSSQGPPGWAQGALYLNTDLTCSMSSGPMPSPGIMVTVCRPPYFADGGWKGGGGGQAFSSLPPSSPDPVGQPIGRCQLRVSQPHALPHPRCSAAHGGLQFPHVRRATTEAGPTSAWTWVNPKATKSPQPDKQADRKDTHNCLLLERGTGRKKTQISRG